MVFDILSLNNSSSNQLKANKISRTGVQLNEYLVQYPGFFLYVSAFYIPVVYAIMILEYDTSTRIRLLLGVNITPIIHTWYILQLYQSSSSPERRRFSICTASTTTRPVNEIAAVHYGNTLRFGNT